MAPSFELARRYRIGRAAGLSALAAGQTARRVIDAVTWERHGDWTYENATTTHTRILDDGTRVVIAADVDNDTTTDDADCYTPEAIDASRWGWDGWRFYVVTVTVTLPDGREGSFTARGVEAGDYWTATNCGADTEQQLIEYALDDMVNVATQEANALPVMVECPTCHGAGKVQA